VNEEPTNANRENSKPLREWEVGTFGELSRRSNPEGLVIVTVPDFEEMLPLLTQRAGRQFTADEIEAERHKASSMVMTLAAAEKMKAASGRRLQGVNSSADSQHSAPKLPDCNEVFAKFFSRDQTIRPDIERVVKQPLPVDAVSALEPDKRAEVQSHIQEILSAAVDEWPRNLDVADTPSFAWVEAFDRRYDRATIQQVIDAADPSEIGNEYVRLCGQFGVVLSEVLRQERPTLVWLYGQPYWESALYDEATGYRVNVFHWAIKKMSEYGVDDGFAAKTRACVNVLRRQTRAQ
jgi:hypothetical protein